MHWETDRSCEARRLVSDRAAQLIRCAKPRWGSLRDAGRRGRCRTPADGRGCCNGNRHHAPRHHERQPTVPMSSPSAMPAAMPRTPPMMLSTRASSRNCTRMSKRRAPRAFLMPISRVRSVTDTSITFITPMPATTSDMPRCPPTAKSWCRRSRCRPAASRPGR